MKPVSRLRILISALCLCVWPAAQAAAPLPACKADATPRLAIVSAFGAEADLLLARLQGAHSCQLGGARLSTGRLEGVPVVITLSGVGMVNAAMSTQRLIDRFRVRALVLSGIAGGVNPARHIGDVIAPERWSMPQEIYWNGDNALPAACGAPAAVECLGLALARDAGGQPYPPLRLAGTATGQFMRGTHLLTAANAPGGEFRFDYPADPALLALAREIRPELLRCGAAPGAPCVQQTPALHVGGRGVSGNAFVANPEYRSYLYDTLQAEAVDMETAALAHVAAANALPFIAFRSLSDLAGGQDYTEVGAFFGSGLAETNAARVTLAFVAAWGRSSRH